MTLQRLYGVSKTGKVKTWKIWVEEDGAAAKILTEHGYEDGEKQVSEVLVTEGKNLGKANETTPMQQACLEAKSKWNKKVDKGYATDKRIAVAGPPILPMLAHDFKKRGNEINWPAVTQPKLNGVRCLASKITNGRIVYTSRGGKELRTIEHLTRYLLEAMDVGQTFDGELYTNSMTFQQILSAVKKLRPTTVQVQYWVYDMFDNKYPNQGFYSRYSSYQKLLGKLEPNTVIVPVISTMAYDLELLKLAHKANVKSHYEGTIIRNMEGPYLFGHRSTDLQKLKDFVHEEFVIVGSKEGVGKDKGAITFLCQTEEGKPFDCRPAGSYDQRKEWWKQRDKLVGQWLTVQYQTRSDDNIPIFPVGVAIRDGATDSKGNFHPEL